MPVTPWRDALLEIVREAAARHDVPGVAVGVRHGDHECYVHHGVTSVAAPRPVDEHTLFQIGSTGKTVTATLIMRLAEGSLLELDAPVRRYLPDFRVRDPEVSTRVTVLNLLNHTAGWDGDFVTDTGSGDDALARFVTGMRDLGQFTPLDGVASYNNAAYNVAGRIAEVVTGLAYEAAVRRHVLDPLGMAETEPSAPPGTEVGRRSVAGHVKAGGRIDVVSLRPSSRADRPAGDLVSTAADQIRYARLHLADGLAPDGTRLLSARSVRRMRGPTAETASGGRIGIAWFLREVGGVRFAFHGGTRPGQQSAFEFAPDHDYAVTVLTNAQHGFVLCEEVTAWLRWTCLDLSDAEPLPAATFRRGHGETP